eukprot:m.95895 g.95895  ORF g.95895 m.95895 type:complete len:550 (+) comp15169_c0_seq2:158-1807(+)
MAMTVATVTLLAVLASLQVPYTQASALVEEHFDDGWDSRWVQSQATKDGAAADIAKYNGVWEVQDGALSIAEANRHYGIARPLSEPFDFSAGKTFVVQYEVKFQKPLECGGAYTKLLAASDDLDLTQMTDKTPFTIMFGPDKCGADAHLRFIYQHKSPATGKYREVHANAIPEAASLLFSDTKTHLVTLVVRGDNSFQIKVDDKQVAEGNLASDDDFDPALAPPKTIDDPTDSKPSDWVDDEMMDDPEDQKPQDWDEDAPEYIKDPEATMPEEWDENAPEMIADPSAEKPQDWDDEEDGDWEPPQIRNPKCDTGCGSWNAPEIYNPDYKGKWLPKRVKNPAYKGPWAPRQLPNPEHFTDDNPVASLRPIAAFAYELWTVTSGYQFRNVYVGDSEAEAQALATELWKPRRDAEDAADISSPSFIEQAQEFLDMAIESANEAPYLWVLYAFVLGIPLVLVCTCFFGSSGDGARPVSRPVADDDSEGQEGDEEGDEEQSDSNEAEEGDADAGDDGEGQEDAAEAGEAQGAPAEPAAAAAKAVRRRKPRASAL